MSNKLIFLLFIFIMFCVGLNFIINNEDIISDAPCTINSISKEGLFTVDRVKTAHGWEVLSSHFLEKIGFVESFEQIAFEDFIKEHVCLNYVSVVLKNEVFDVMFLDMKDNKIKNLNNELLQHLNRRKNN